MSMSLDGYIADLNDGVADLTSHLRYAVSRCASSRWSAMRHASAVRQDQTRRCRTKARRNSVEYSRLFGAPPQRDVTRLRLAPVAAAATRMWHGADIGRVRREKRWESAPTACKIVKQQVRVDERECLHVPFGRG
jgi:hypothetical protein